MIALHMERLTIRNFSNADYASLHELVCWYSSTDMAAYDHPWPTAPGEVRKIVEWFAGGDQFLAVDLNEPGQFAGFFSLNPEPGEAVQTYNFGCIFHPRFHGKGIATESGTALLNHAFRELRADQVVSGTAMANAASCRLLERLGFEKTGESLTSFQITPAGDPIKFLGISYSLPRARWADLSVEAGREILA